MHFCTFKNLCITRGQPTKNDKHLNKGEVISFHHSPHISHLENCIIGAFPVFHKSEIRKWELSQTGFCEGCSTLGNKTS